MLCDTAHCPNGSRAIHLKWVDWGYIGIQMAKYNACTL